MWWDDSGVESDVYELKAVAPGQTVEGPAVLESAATTFTIPPGRRAALDRHRIFHLER